MIGRERVRGLSRRRGQSHEGPAALGCVGHCQDFVFTLGEMRAIEGFLTEGVPTSDLSFNMIPPAALRRLDYREAGLETEKPAKRLLQESR